MKIKKWMLFLLSGCMMFSCMYSVSPQEVQAAPAMIKGIDVSSFQGSINWTAVADSGVRFAVIRCGTTNIANANYSADSRFEANYQAAFDAGISVGTYMYTSANSESEINMNVTSMLNTIKGKTFAYPVYLDVEQATRQTALGKEKLTDVILYGLQLIRKAGYTAGVYANQNWFNNYVNRDRIVKEGFEIWLARYPSGEYAVDPSNYDYSTSCSVWQYSSKGAISGISGNVDVDVSYKDYHPIPSRMTISNHTIPENLSVGQFFGVYGDIISNLPIEVVWGGVYNDDWTVTAEYAETKPNTTSYSLYPYFDDRIIFNHLPEGFYHYLIKAKDTTGEEYILINEPFIVGNPARLQGDVTNDGQLTVADAILLQKWLMNAEGTTLPNWNKADLNSDRRLNAIDLALLKRNLITE